MAEVRVGRGFRAENVYHAGGIERGQVLDPAALSTGAVGSERPPEL